MDISKIDFEQFRDRLKDRGVTEIYSLLAAYDVRLPAGITDKGELLRLAYDAVQAKAAAVKNSGPVPAGKRANVSTSDDGAPPAAPPKPAGAGRLFRMRCKTGSRWRCARQFTSAYELVRESEFGAAEWKALRADPCIQIIEVAE